MPNKIYKLTSRASIEWDWENKLAYSTTKNAASHAKTINAEVSDNTKSYYADKLYSAQHSIGIGGTLTLNIQNGSLKDFIGNSLVFTSLRFIEIEVVSGPENTAVMVTPLGTFDGTFLPIIWDNFGNPHDKPVYVGGVFQEVNPLGYDIAVLPSFAGFSIGNPTGGAVVVNVTFAGM